MDTTAQPIEVHLRTANNLVTTAASTRLPEQKETIHMIQMLRQEACSGQMHDLAHVLTQYCLAALVNKESLTGRCFVSATDLDGTRTTSTTLEMPLPSLEGMTGYIVFETHGGSRLSDYWQQKTKSRLSRVHVTLFTPRHASVDS